MQNNESETLLYCTKCQGVTGVAMGSKVFEYIFVVYGTFINLMDDSIIK